MLSFNAHPKRSVRRVQVQYVGRRAEARLDVIRRFDRLIAQGIAVKEACRAVDVKKSTLYRWKKALYDGKVAGLEPKSRVPRRKRKPQWTMEQQARVCELRNDFPWGKAKIHVIMCREGHSLSQSTIGRILSRLRELGRIQPVPSARFRQRNYRRRRFEGHAQRWSYDKKAKELGHMIQLDHMTVRTDSEKAVKHFDAVCPISKVAVADVYSSATSRCAKTFLDKMQGEFPFPIHSVQVDGGSEFMDEFEQACKDRGIQLYVLPPKRPQYNGNVERCNGTFRYEFYGAYVLPDTLAGIRKELSTFQDLYNSFRPHQALRYQTPFEYLATLQSVAN